MTQQNSPAAPRDGYIAADCPKLKALRDELAETKRQFASVLNSLSGFFYRCELEAPWRMSFLSDGVEQLTGYSRSELKSHAGWARIMRADERAAVEHAVSEAVRNREGFELAYCITKKTGEVCWVSERGCAIYDDADRPIFLEGVITDISGRKEADQLQRTMIKRWRRTLDAIPQMVWTMAGDGSEQFYNAQWTHFTGSHIGTTQDLDRADLVHPDDREAAVALWKDRFESGAPYEAQYRLKHVSGDYRWVLSRGQLERDSGGQALRWYGTCTDIHEEVLGRQALQASETLNRSMIEASPDCISLLDIEGKVRFLNRAAVRALGLTDPSEIIGRSWAGAFAPNFRAPALTATAQAIAGGTGRFTTTQRLRGGQRWWDILVAPIHGDSTGLDGLISIARDITQQKTAEDQIRWAANHDQLTQLPNRALFQHTLDRAIGDAKGGGAPVTVLMMDLDDFKRTNDALGHDAGDALLTEFAARLRNGVRADDMVARLGGDEFAVLLQSVSTDDEIQAAVDSILAALQVPCEFEGKLLDIRTSIGASVFPVHGVTRSELLKHADIALYAAKAAGRGVLRVFRPAMRAEAQRGLSMLSLARDAIRDDRIVTHYQPKVNLRSGLLDGFEALLRWNHPIKGIQAPETIAAAFQDGILAAQISDRIIDCAIRDMREWSDRGVEFGHVAVNAAAAEFRSGRFAEKLLERLHRAGLPTSSFQLEVTETVFLGRGAEHVENTLRELSKEGIQIALDDFGTGYASLSHLNKFPVNVLKVDRSFIRKLEKSEHDAAIVRAVIKLGRSLGIKIVAEGVESNGQVEFLRKHRCDTGQGYLFAKAMPAHLVPIFIQNWDVHRKVA